MTVIGDVDPVLLTIKLRKIGFTELLSVGSAKEEKKKAEKKMESKRDIANKGGNYYLGMQRMEAAAGFRGMNWAIEDARSKERIIETVAGFGDFTSMSNMKKMVFRVALDEKNKIRAMQAVAGVGVESIAVDLREGKMTVIGDADPVHLTVKIRKLGFSAELVSVGPAKEEKKEAEKRMEAAAGFRGTSCAIEDARSKERIIETVAGFGGMNLYYH